jgi:hypothetical protein
MDKKTHRNPSADVIPVKTGIQEMMRQKGCASGLYVIYSRLRGNDNGGVSLSIIQVKHVFKF